MNYVLRFAAVLVSMLLMASESVHAQETAPAPSATTAAHYSVDNTPIGELLDDPDARAVLDKHIPGFSSGDQIDLARGMTLRGIQPFAQDTMTDEVLANIEADLGQL